MFLWFSWLVLQPSSIHLSWDGVFQQLKDSPFQLCYWFDFLVFLQIDSTRRSYQTQLGQRNPNRLNVQLEHLAFFFGSLFLPKKRSKPFESFWRGSFLRFGWRIFWKFLGARSVFESSPGPWSLGIL